MTFKPTAEQVAIVKAFTARKSLVIEAGAGTGKTSTLKLMAEATSRRGLYIAYNKAIATEAKGKFPRNVECGTAHSYAFRAVGRKYAARLNGGRMPSWKAAKHLGILGPHKVGDRLVNPDAMARLAMEMVAKFCSSADREITLRHMPYVEGLDTGEIKFGPNHKALAPVVLGFAVKAWEDINKVDGVLRFQHDHYLKMWQLTNPVLDVDFILFDEAQDADPVIASIVARQTHTQRVFVGDRAQAIYGWRGAVDAMAIFAREPGVEVLYLAQSFRFGPAIASAANRFLALLDTPLRIKGDVMQVSKVEACMDAKAVLTRTNAGALRVALDAQQAGKAVHLVGGGSQVSAFVKAAQQLQETGSTTYPDLAIFTSWGMVQDYVEQDPDGTDLAMLVRLVDEYGADVILGVLDASVAADKADLVVSTAHKSKGLEWDSVRIGDDFTPKQRKNDEGETEDKPLEPGEIMLRYVAVTRARKVLDLGPLGEMFGDSSSGATLRAPANA